MKSVSIIYIPLEVGAKYGGTNLGPEAIKGLGFEAQLADAGITISSSQTINCNPREELSAEPASMPYIEEILRASESSAELVDQYIKDGNLPIAIGGDHSVNLGLFAGASNACSGDIGMIYIDAHGDINTPDSSISHNVHGMHLAALMGFGDDSMVNVFKPGIKLKKENLLHVAGKDFDEFELDLLKNENIANYSMDDIELKGMTPLLAMIDDLSSRVSNVWISFDLDAVDLEYAPGVGIQNKGGLTYREAMAICRYIARSCNVAGVDVVECNPPKDVDNMTAKLAIDVVLSLLGKSPAQYGSYMSEF